MALSVKNQANIDNSKSSSYYKLYYLVDNGIPYLEFTCRYCKTDNILRFKGADVYKCGHCKNPITVIKKK